MQEKTYIYHVDFHSHADHIHYRLNKKVKHSHNKHEHHHEDHDHHHHGYAHHEDHHYHHHHHHDHGHSTSCKEHHEKKEIGKDEEGCPCCAAAIDLDEVATALNEIGKNGGNIDGHTHSMGEIANFSSAAHWGIFLGISGPLALTGLTAAIRNIKGTFNNRKNLKLVIKGLDDDIKEYKKQKNKKSCQERQNIKDVIIRLEAFRENLKYSKFDTEFNLIVPGVINGAASTAVLSSAVVTSPWALPLIALYAGCQTMRNGYDLWRIWNKILPEEISDEVQLNISVGTKKLNQITNSKRKFYAANTAGFAMFTAGAVITTLSAFSVVGAPGMAVGIPLLATGAVSTGITNNVWTNKFKPRNGDLGVDRKELDLEFILEKIGQRRDIKKLLKNYRKEHLLSKSMQRFKYSFIAAMPFCDKRGAKGLHKINLLRVDKSNGTNNNRLDLLERLLNLQNILKNTGNKKELNDFAEKIINFKEVSDTEIKTFGWINIKKNNPVCREIFTVCKKLEIDRIVLEKFINNFILKSVDEHNNSIKNKEEYLNKLRDSGLFTITNEDIKFDVNKLQENEEYQKNFMKALEETLLFDYVEKLKYQQYGLNDFYWSLKKQNKQHQKDKKIHNKKHDHVHGKSKNHACIKQGVFAKDIDNYHHCSSHFHSSINQANEATITSISCNSSSASKSRENISNYFEEFASEKAPHKQNHIIDKIKGQSKEFILESKAKNYVTKQTFFVYRDPRDVENDNKKIIYVLDDNSKKINVLFGQEAEAVLIEKPKNGKNGVISELAQGKARQYGNLNDTILESFQTIEKKNIPTSNVIFHLGTNFVGRLNQSRSQNSRVA